MIEPLGYKPKYPNLVMTVLIAYLVNLILPRAGEVARATALSKYEKVPFEKGFGTIVAERIADVIMLLAIISLAFVLQGDLIKSYLFKEESNSYNSQITIGVFAVFAIVSYFILKKSCLLYTSPSPRDRG